MLLFFVYTPKTSFPLQFLSVVRANSQNLTAQRSQHYSRSLSLCNSSPSLQINSPLITLYTLKWILIKMEIKANQ